MPGSVQVFVGCSLDGFIAGPDDDLSWLTDPGGESSGDSAADGEEAGEREDHGFNAFFAQVGSMVMGRRTYDVVRAFEGDWFYGDKPILVATTRPLGETPSPSVRAVSGTPAEMLAEAREIAGDTVVYVDGGILIRSFLDAGLIDEMTVSVLPIILGDGIPLFAGATKRHKLELIEMSPSGGKLVQLRYRPAGRG